MATSHPQLAGKSIPMHAQRFSPPRWNTHTILLFALGSAALIGTLVLLLVHRSIWQELRLLIAALSAFVFVFLCTVLYRGVRFDRDGRWTLGWVHPRSLVDNISGVDTLGGFTEAGANQGVTGFLIGLLLDILVSILLVAAIVLIVWLGINVAIAAVAVIWFPLIYFFRRSLRYIVTRGRKCRGKLLRAAGWAGFYTAVNAAWLYAILVISRRVAEWE